MPEIHVPATWTVSYFGVLDTTCSTGQLFRNNNLEIFLTISLFIYSVLKKVAA